MISQIHSATLMVRDQDEALDFYVNKLGFEKLSDEPYGEGSRWVVVAPPGAATGLALSTPRDMGRSEEAHEVYKGVSLLTPDIDVAYERLCERGVVFTQPPQMMPWGAKATWFTDPDGNEFFLTEQ